MSSKKNKKIKNQFELRENPNYNKSYYQQIIDELDKGYDWSDVKNPFERAKKISKMDYWAHKFIGFGVLLLYFFEDQDIIIKKQKEYIDDKNDFFTFLITSTLQIEKLPIENREKAWEELYELVYDIDIDILKLDANMEIIRKLLKN